LRATRQEIAMRILDIALKDLRQISRDRMSFFFLLIMPIVFTLMFGFAFAGGDGASGEEPRLPVTVVDHDGGPLSAPLVALLEQSPLVQIQPAEEQTQWALEAAVAAGDLAALVVVPDGYGTQMLVGHPLPLTLIADPGSSAAGTIEGALRSILTRLSGAVRAAELSTEIYARRAGFTSVAEREAFFAEGVQEALLAWDEPPVTVAVTDSGSPPDAAPEQGNAFTQFSPGMMAQFALAGLISAAQVLVLERRSRALARLLTTTVSRAQILFGHFLAMFVMILIQMLLLMLFGQLALDVDYFGEPLASVLLAVATAAFAASLGLLIGALAKTEEQAIIYAMVPMFVLAALGGAWVSLEVTPAAYQQIGSVTPLGWVLDGYRDILLRDAAVETVLPSVAALLGYAVVIFGLAVWRFRFEGER
jgi:ABC-2 type transport system permease protein